MKHIGRRLLALMLALVLAVGLLPGAQAIMIRDLPFKDVSDNAWYRIYVDYVYHSEPRLMEGVSKDLFRPEGTCTRAMAAVVLSRLAEPDFEKIPDATFKDLNQDWYMDGIAWAQNTGVIQGMENNRFWPDKAVTREQMVTMIWRFAGEGLIKEDNLEKFTDSAKVSDWAVGAMRWAVDCGIIEGNDKLELNPQKPMKRAEFAKVIAVFAEQMLTYEEIKVPSTLRDGAQIPVYLTLPSYYTKEGNFPVALLIHGHGGNHNESGGYDRISDGLARNGIVVVTIDFPGCGASKESFRLNTMTNMKQDVLDVLTHVIREYGLDDTHVGALGYSMGGRIVLEMTAEELFAFDAVEFVAPAEDGEDLKGLFGGPENWEKLKAEANEKGYVTFTTIYGQVQELSKEWFADLEKYPNGLNEAAKPNYKGATPLTIWATDDVAVSPWVSQGVAETFNSAVVNTYKEGHSYCFYGMDPYTVKTVNRALIGYMTHELQGYKNPIEGYIQSIAKYGNLELTIDGQELVDAGFEPGDILKITVNGKEYLVPYCTNYSDVDTGSILLRNKENHLTLAYNMSDFATRNGIAEKVTKTVDEKKFIEWYYEDDVEIPGVVTIEMAEKGGYREEWEVRQLERYNEREKYPDLTDAQFANFRCITGGDLETDFLYRSSSPINPELGRNTYADTACEAAGIKYIVNLADTEDTAKAYEGFGDTYYSKQTVLYLGLGIDFEAEDFKAGMVEAIRFIGDPNHSSDPILIHCTEGKDRAGFLSALLACYMGVPYEDVIQDYLTSYYWYYFVEPQGTQAEYIANSNIIKTLEKAFQVEDLSKADLHAEAAAYLTEAGATEEDLEHLTIALVAVS